jgi:hypothetical protein
VPTCVKIKLGILWLHVDSESDGRELQIENGKMEISKYELVLSFLNPWKPVDPTPPTPPCEGGERHMALVT